MKQSVVRELSTQELSEKIFETKREYSKMKLAHAVSPLENPLVLRAKRRTVARLLTEATRRQNEDSTN